MTKPEPNLPARDVSAPASISAQAQAILNAGYGVEPPPFPASGDITAWRQMVAAQTATMEPMADAVLAMPGARVELHEMGRAKVYVATPATTKPHVPKAHLNMHGGGWLSLGGKMTATVTKFLADAYGGVVYGVDYRGANEEPAPAALDDCFEAYAALIKIHKPRDILVSGDSAGANLAAALMHRVRDAGLPPPGALFLNTPAVDLTCSGDTFKILDGIDPRLGSGGTSNVIGLYSAGADLASPYLSPINGDLSRGFPPTYLRTGTRDLLLSDTVRMHAALRKAGVEADLYVVEAMPHGGFDGMNASTPEDAEARTDFVRWIARHFD